MESINSADEKRKKGNNRLKGGVYIPKWLLGLMILVVLVVAVFALGWHIGADRQKTNDQQGQRVLGGLNSPAFQRHRALVGTVSKISSSSITVEILDNQQSSAIIGSSTMIKNVMGQTVSAKSIALGSRVVVTAQINSNSSLTAQRILVIN